MMISPDSGSACNEAADTIAGVTENGNGGRALLPLSTRRSDRWILLCLAFFAAACVFYVVVLANPNRVIVRNSSGSRVDDLRLVLRHRGKDLVSRGVPELDPGDSFILRHDYSDFSVQIRFALSESVHEPDEDFVDLWTDEGWVIDIQANGAAKSGYDTSR